MRPDRPTFPHEAFADLIEANREVGPAVVLGAPRAPARGLVVLTCIDARLDPLHVLGLHAGDALLVRNPGARVTDETLSALAVATRLLGANRLLVLAHSDCRMADGDEASIREALRATGLDASDLSFAASPDQRVALAHDIARLRTSGLIAPGVVVAGALLDHATGRLEPLDA